MILPPGGENTNLTGFHNRIFPESRRFLKDIQFTDAFGRVGDKSTIREFSVHNMLQKTETYIDNRFSLIEMLFLERVLYSDK